MARKPGTISRAFEKGRERTFGVLQSAAEENEPLLEERAAATKALFWPKGVQIERLYYSSLPTLWRNFIALHNPDGTETWGEWCENMGLAGKSEAYHRAFIIGCIDAFATWEPSTAVLPA
jgi:hypothetical protein